MVVQSAIEVLRSDLERLKPQLNPLLKDETDKFVAIASNFIELNQKLLDSGINRPSLFAAIMKAAQLRLFIDGQETSLVPFGSSVTMMTGYKGLLKLVRNSGELASINAGVVYEKDFFDFFVDEKGEHLTHKPAWGKDRGKKTHAYCIARMKGSAEPYIEVMTAEEVEACKNQSGAVKRGYDTPWKGPFDDEMWKKCPIRRISKRLPMSTDFNMAVHSDDELFNVQAETEEDPVPAVAKTQSPKLEKAILATDTPAPAQTQMTIEEVTPEQKKADAKKIEDFKKQASQSVEGVLNYITAAKQKTDDPAKQTRFSCKIGTVFYGTWDKDVYKKIEDFYNKKSVVKITFVTLMNTATPPKPYNDILEVSESFGEEEIPI